MKYSQYLRLNTSIFMYINTSGRVWYGCQSCSGSAEQAKIFFPCPRSRLKICLERKVRQSSPASTCSWDRNPGFLKSEIGPFSDFKKNSYFMGLKLAHSQEFDCQESGEVDKFLEMGTHFQERSGSLENGLRVTWSGFWLCPRYLWLLILVSVEQTYDQITRRLVAQRVAPAARVILSQTQAFGDGGY